MNEAIQTGFLAIIAAFVLWFGWKKGFFRWSPLPWNGGVHLKHVLLVFALYFAVSFVFVPLLRPLFNSLQPIGIFSWLNFLITATILASLTLVVWISRLHIWHSPNQKNYTLDFQMGFYAWCLSFPLVLLITKLLEELVYLIFNVTVLPDQIAVQFVKMTFEYPSYFAMAVFTIVILTPFVEELLFRGFLQSFIRKHLGSKQAIVITSACFSLFHYSFDQGLANIPIVGALFFLALFLGFLYEKQGSLFAPISLHALFNAISILNLYFFGGFQCFF